MIQGCMSGGWKVRRVKAGGRCPHLKGGKKIWNCAMEKDRKERHMTICDDIQPTRSQWYCSFLPMVPKKKNQNQKLIMRLVSQSLLIFSILITLSTFSPGHKIYWKAGTLYTIKYLLALGSAELYSFDSTSGCSLDHSGTKPQHLSHQNTRLSSSKETETEIFGLHY